MTTSDSPQPPLTITLFGPMQTSVAGQPIPPLRSRRALWLLALLSLRANQPVARTWLAATLWPDLDSQRAAANFRTILSELRNALSTEAGRLQTPNRLFVILDLSGADVDVLAFDAAIRGRQLPALQRAVEMYRGPLLEDCLEEWAIPERIEREHKCLLALHTLGEASAATGDHLVAAGYYRQAIAINPLSDQARRGLMDALAKSGDINSALQVYRDFAELLRNDPAAAPDKSTTELYSKLRAESRSNTGAKASVSPDRTPEQVVRGYLPHPLTHIIGREDEKVEVSHLLRRSRLVTLTGMGGIGKTRLAILVAGWSKDAYADGVWLAALDSISDSNLVTPQIASVLGVKEETSCSLLQSLVKFLRHKRLLLVLDNCEHLMDACASIIGSLLTDCVGLRILVTSREALGITGESVWAVPALSFPDPNHLPKPQSSMLRVLAGYDAVQLFIERAEAVQKTFLLSGANGLAVAHVCSQLDGVPLAIELAAARLRTLTVVEISTRLSDHLALLTGSSRISANRQQTLRATLDWSYLLLTESEALMLRRLSVFAGGWTLEAAEQVCSGGEIGTEDVLSLLTSLADKSLVTFEERETGGRFRFLETVRQYAAEKLRTNLEGEAIKKRHGDWCVRLAERADDNMDGAEQAVWLQHLESEHDNFRQALAWTDSQGSETNVRLAGALWRFWDIRGYHNEGQKYLTNALVRNEGKPKTNYYGRALNGAGAMAAIQGDYAAAWDLNLQCVNVYRALGDRRGTAAALSNLSMTAREQGNYASALALQEESLSIHRDLDNRPGIGHTLASMGVTLLDMGDFSSAKGHFEESLQIRREFGDKRSLAWSLENLGITAHLLGDHSTARELLEESLQIREEVGDKFGIALSFCNLGNVITEMGDDSVAQSLLQKGITLFNELGNKLGVLHCLEGLAGLMLRVGKIQTSTVLWGAAAALREALAISRPEYDETKCTKQIGEARQLLGDDAFDLEWKRGYHLNYESVVVFALAA